MIDFFPDSATLAATIADPRFSIAVAISILAGMVRGFSGFGAARADEPGSGRVSRARTNRVAALAARFARQRGGAPICSSAVTASGPPSARACDAGPFILEYGR